MPATPAWFESTLTRELWDRPRLSALQVMQLWQHYEILLRWNQRISLTTVAAGEEMVIRHYCESLYFGAYLPADAKASIVDVGSGAGFPGVPVAVMNAGWRVTLVESSQRKAVFLREATRGIPNISVVAKRGEAISDHFDWLIARAVDPLEVVKLLPRVAANIGLMIGEDDFLTLRMQSDVAWREPVRLPWGDRRLCLFGDVSRGTKPEVSRETSE